MHPKIKSTEIADIRHFGKQIGKVSEYWGFKAVQRRIWRDFFLSRRPLHSRELTQLAEASPSRVTQSIQVLLDYEAILSAGKGPNGILLLVANPNAAAAVLKVLESREARLLKKIEDSEDRLDLDLKTGHQAVQWLQMTSALLEGAMQLLSANQNPFSHPEVLNDLIPQTLEGAPGGDSL